MQRTASLNSTLSVTKSQPKLSSTLLLHGSNAKLSELSVCAQGLKFHENGENI